MQTNKWELASPSLSSSIANGPHSSRISVHRSTVPPSTHSAGRSPTCEGGWPELSECGTGDLPLSPQPVLQTCFILKTSRYWRVVTRSTLDSRCRCGLLNGARQLSTDMSIAFSLFTTGSPASVSSRQARNAAHSTGANSWRPGGFWRDNRHAVPIGTDRWSDALQPFKIFWHCSRNCKMALYCSRDFCIFPEAIRDLRQDQEHARAPSPSHCVTAVTYQSLQWDETQIGATGRAKSQLVYATV
jgi:hypothetical protein